MKIPTMLNQYLESIGQEASDMSKDELLDNAVYVKRLDSIGEWWGFAECSFEKSERAMRNELTRFINKLS